MLIGAPTCSSPLPRERTLNRTAAAVGDVLRHAGPVKLALVTQLLEWLRPFFDTFGYVIVSVAMFFESAAFTGIFVPGDVILAIGGVYAAEGSLSLTGVIACGALFGVLGTSAGYLLGRRYGDALLRRAPILRRRASPHPGAGLRCRECRKDNRAWPIRDRGRGVRSVRRGINRGPTSDVLRLCHSDDGRLVIGLAFIGYLVGDEHRERSTGSFPASASPASAWRS